jgi:hypothetical protein
MTRVAITKVALVTIAAGVFVIGGCFYLPLGTVGGVPSEEVKQLNKQVRLYQPGELNGVEYLKVETITAWSCDESLFGIDTTDQDQVVAKIKEKAQSVGANGITNLACEKGPPGCTGSMKCTATAVKVASGSPQTR